MEKPKNLYAQPVDMNYAGGGNTGEGFIMVRDKGEKNGTTVVA